MIDNIDRPTRHNHGVFEIHLPECVCAITPYCSAKRFDAVVKRFERFEATDDLLAALDLTCRTVQDALRHGLTPGQIEALKEMLDVSHAAIAKARGE